jgi:hypothetical protein
LGRNSSGAGSIFDCFLERLPAIVAGDCFLNGPFQANLEIDIEARSIP